MSEVGTYAGAEVVFGLVAPVGTEFDIVVETLEVALRAYGYDTDPIRLSRLTARLDRGPSEAIPDGSEEFRRLMGLMAAGNRARQLGGGGVLALAAAAAINARRAGEPAEQGPLLKRAHIIRSLKHPGEAQALRRIYGPGFFLIGIVATEGERRSFLAERRGCSDAEIDALFRRDEDEGELKQRTRDTFQYADVFLRLRDSDGLKRFLRLVFGDPYVTPAADEHAMFVAFTSALRSGDLSRQVGAVVVSPAGDIVAVGCNDVPRPGGGLYWPGGDDHRDLVLGEDPNETERGRIVEDLLRRLLPVEIDREDPAAVETWMATSRAKVAGAAIMDITEYGRAVHAEMDALLSCARSAVSTREATLFSTTFPCHNCAKHIIAAGIKRVVYVEPYPKSRARQLYPQAISIDIEERTDAPARVSFEGFRGIGPRRFFDLFSIALSSGYRIKRKEDGRRRRWHPGIGSVRVPMLPNSYIEREQTAVKTLAKIDSIEDPTHDQADP